MQMFSYRCYNCGLTLGEGLPPMEALSEEQAAAVGVSPEVEAMPPPFEGMSPYSFCGFCNLMIREFPSCIKHPQHEFVHGKRASTRPDAETSPHTCTCGFVYEGHPTYPQDTSKWWIWANRMRLLHVAKLVYPNGDFALAESLINEEV